MNFVKISLM